MPSWGPISHRELVRYLKQLGFEGPYAGGRHLFMVRGNLKLTIPNPHKGDISIGLLSRLLKQAGVSKAEWTKL